MDGQLRIDEMYAFIVVDPRDGTEGVIGIRGPDGWLPMVGADLARIEALRPIAQQQATHFGTSVTLAVFSERRDVETLDPERG